MEQSSDVSKARGDTLLEIESLFLRVLEHKEGITVHKDADLYSDIGACLREALCVQEKERTEIDDSVPEREHRSGRFDWIPSTFNPPAPAGMSCARRSV